MVFGALPLTAAMTFAGIYRRNGDCSPLPVGEEDALKELERRCERILVPMQLLWTRLAIGSMPTAHDVALHVQRVELFVGSLNDLATAVPSPSMQSQLPLLVLRPPDTVCDECSGPHSDSSSASQAIRLRQRVSASGAANTAPSCLTRDGVQRVEEIMMECPCCNAVFGYHTIRRPPSMAQRLEGQLNDIVTLRAKLASAPFIQTVPGKSVMWVERSLLVERLVAAERMQMPAMGYVETLHQLHRIQGAPGEWGSVDHANEHFDQAFFFFLLEYVQDIIQRFRPDFRRTDASAYAARANHGASELLQKEWTRTANTLTEVHFERFTKKHMTICTLMDMCKLVVSDGNHTTGPVVCDNIMLHSLMVDGLTQIPYGCRGQPTQWTNYCKSCIHLMAQRTPHEDGVDRRIYRDPGRADAAGDFLRKANAEAGASAKPAASSSSSSAASGSEDTTTNKQQARRSSSEQISKRADAYTFRQKIEARGTAERARKAAAEKLPDAGRLYEETGLDAADHLEPSEGPAYAPLGGNVYIAKQIVRKLDEGVGTRYEVDWLGWARTTIEPPSNLQAHQIEDFEEALRKGEPPPNLYKKQLDRATTEVPDDMPDIVTMTEYEFAKMVKESKCRTLKVAQRGEPVHGHQRHAAGTMAWAADCGIVLYYLWMINSESGSLNIYGYMKIMKEAAEFWATRKGSAMDDNCHIYKQLLAQLRDQPEHSESKEIFRKLLFQPDGTKFPWVIDRFHFKNHLVRDKFCQDNCNPNAPEHESLEGSNSEVCEQLFRWLTRFALMLTNMGIAKATLFQAVMMWQHSERVIVQRCESTKAINDGRLGELRAAYGLAEPDATGAASRRELAEHLLTGQTRWSPSLLEAHRVRVRLASRKRRAPAVPGSKRPK